MGAEIVQDRRGPVEIIPIPIPIRRDNGARAHFLRGLISGMVFVLFLGHV
jgi:hypothetical protein